MIKGFGMTVYKVACGSVIGHDHLRLGKNNQDAWQVMRSKHHLVAVVCDGCGSGLKSEVGAQLGARLITQSLINQYYRWPWAFNLSVEEALEKARLHTLKKLEATLSSLGRNRNENLNDFLLFTVVGVCITRHQATFFSLGDGMIAVNQDVKTIGPFEDNTPPYLAYGLAETKIDPRLLKFQIQAKLPTATLNSWMIGSDGVNDLIASADKHMPGKTELVGPISQFWNEERFFSNPDQIRRRLSLINREVNRPNWNERRMERFVGHLPDDTTLIVGCKSQED
jgi:hypothetical protein